MYFLLKPRLGLLLLFCFIPSLASAGIEVPESIHSFMKNHCYRCHGAEAQEADLSLHDMARVIKDSADALNWQDILDKLNAGEMPPEDELQSSSHDAARKLETNPVW